MLHLIAYKYDSSIRLQDLFRNKIIGSYILI